MSPYQQILAAVEVNEEGLTVLRRAVQLAEIFNAQLTVLNVVEPLPTVGEITLPIDLTDERVSTARATLQDWAGLLDIEPRLEVAIGMPREEVLTMAEQVNADLIVVGHHPHGWLSQLLPHTDQAVLGRSRRDVLAIALKA